MRDIDKYGYFNSEIDKYNLDQSTFDLIYVDAFKNTKSSTVFWYLMTWLMMFLSWVLLGIDIYTCLSILVFHHWSSNRYQPYAYSIAKWVFTGCIIFEFALLLFHWIRAVRAYRTRNIALAYVNGIARLLYIIRSYNYFCLFHAIEEDNFFDWACFLCYTELDNAPQILIADTPRQVINILTLRYYATDGDVSNDIISNIKNIADTNLTLSIILSFICLSVVIWSIFFFKFILAMILLIPIKVKLRNREYKSLKKYCCMVVNKTVRLLVRKHHRPKSELLEKGVLDLKDIAENPLLNSSTTTFNDDFKYNGIVRGDNNTISKPGAIHRTYDDYRYNDNTKLQNYAKDSTSYEDLPMSDITKTKTILEKPFSNASLYKSHNESASSLSYPFSDRYRIDYKDQGSDTGFSQFQKNDSQVALISNPFIQDNSSLPKIPLAHTSSHSDTNVMSNNSLDTTESNDSSQILRSQPYPIDIQHENENLSHNNSLSSSRDIYGTENPFDKGTEDNDSSQEFTFEEAHENSLDDIEWSGNHDPKTTPYPYRNSSIFKS